MVKMLEQQKLGPCQMHSVFSDAEEWKAYEEIRRNINAASVKQDLIDEATDLKRQADRLLRLAGRL